MKALHSQADKEFLENEYLLHKKSIREIAKELQLSFATIRRALLFHQIELRSKSEAQTNALVYGKTTHPTKNKSQDYNTRKRISESMGNYWDNLSKKKINERIEYAKRQWKEKNKQEKDRILKKANQGLREAAKHGTKLEYYIYNGLREVGFPAELKKCGCDILVESKKFAIHVLGPNIWKSNKKNVDNNINYSVILIYQESKNISWLKMDKVLLQIIDIIYENIKFSEIKV